MTALVVIATGTKYHQYIAPLLLSAQQNFIPHDVLLFTDSAHSWDRDTRVRQVRWPDLGFPQATLRRYHAILAQQEFLARYPHVFYVDVDMLFVEPILEDEVLSDGITATMHAGFVGGYGTPEDRVASTAYCPRPCIYFAGGFVGGETGAFLRMAETIRRNVDADAARGITAIWHDESHLNRYLFDNPPAKVLTPSYCHAYYRRTWREAGYAEDFEPKISVIEKPK